MMIMGGITFPQTFSAVNTANSSLPSQPVVTETVRIDQGVRLRWLPSQPGQHAISGYIIEKYLDDAFMKIATTEKSTLEYLDNQGREGDKYRVIAQDDELRPKRSSASEIAIATVMQPGQQVNRTLSTGQLQDALTRAQKEGITSEKATQLSHVLVAAFDDVDTSLKHRDQAAAGAALQLLQTAQQEGLSKLPAVQRSQLQQVCKQKLPVFEANMRLLSEKNRLQGMMVYAGCNALIGLSA